MNKSKAVLTVAVSALILSTSSLAAQTQVNMAKITCGELLNSYVEEVAVVGVWMSGFYNGKRNNTTINIKTLKSNSERVTDFCSKNPKLTVMKAIETVAH